MRNDRFGFDINFNFTFKFPGSESIYTCRRKADFFVEKKKKKEKRKEKKEKNKVLLRGGGEQEVGKGTNEYMGNMTKGDVKVKGNCKAMPVTLVKLRPPGGLRDKDKFPAVGELWLGNLGGI